MAGRRKAEIQLQMQIESQEEWEELMSKEGLNGTISEKKKNSSNLLDCVVHLFSWILQLSVQSVPIITNGVSLNPVHGEVYSIQCDKFCQ